MKNALLVLADGTEFRGRAAGAAGVAVGEVVFNTAMTGYQEVVTDPSYAGQIVTMTAPHIGNYGVAARDEQRQTPLLAGLVVRAMSRITSSWRAEGSLPDFLVRHGVVALTDVDTRRLTRHIRDNGAMAAAMSSESSVAELAELAAAHGSMSGRDLATSISIGGVRELAAAGQRIGTVVAYDLGIKEDILSELRSRGLDVVVVPAHTSAADALSHSPDGIFLSNGPGDPEPVAATIEAVGGLLGKLPVFGICLGHQILGLSLGAATYKLPFGHHGGNHPVQRLSDGTVDITAQNHGFAVDLWSLAGADAPRHTGGLPDRSLLPERVDGRFGGVVPTHQNLNDGTLEGLSCLDIPAMSVQYHPEAAPGPNDALHLFDRFTEMMEVAHATA